MKAPLPTNETQRLESLRRYDVLDTPSEAAFDDLTLLAAHICGVPTAMVSLVDENRQWFKSKLGLGAPETARDISFCAHTILRPREVLEVPDALADARFADSPLVTEAPYIRFYAGAPLVTASGHALGALCVMDTAPRNLTVDQLAALQALSRRVVAQLELRRQARELQAREQEATRLLDLAERSRRALLSVLEDEKLATRTLRESEERFRQMIANGSDIIALVDAHGLIRFQSPSTFRILGHLPEEMTGRRIEEYINPEDQPKVREAIQRALAGQERPAPVEYRCRHRDGSWRILQSMGKAVTGPAGESIIVVNSRDVTDQKALEEQFLHAQRMEAIGTLASGVAHDLNNILAPILMIAGLLKIRNPGTAKDVAMLDMIERSGQRGADIIRQLLTFSRSVPGERGPVQLKHLVRDMAAIIRETFPRNIVLVEFVPPDLSTVEADPTQLHQVLMNLCVNARDAMPTGGTLTLSVDNLPVTNRGLMDPALRSGAWIHLIVRDTGHGIPPAILNRIFDPFFTTKGVGKGTGLGLSTVVGIIKGHEGLVRVESEPGQGTAFHVYLPAIPAGRADGPVGVVAPPPTGHAELILVVDDEPSIRETTCGLLEQHGYRVMSADTGEEAVKLFIRHPGAIGLVLTDMMMPGMDGLALIKTLRSLQPSARVIVSSGLDQNHNAAEFGALGVMAVLAKPYTPANLLRAVDAALVK